MKKLTLLTLAIVSLVGTQSLKAQTVEEVITNHVNAVGGKEKLDSLKSVRKTGGMTVQGTDVGIVVTILNGVGSRNDISVMGQEGFQVTTPVKGWNFMPFLGQASPEELTPDQLKSAQYLVDAQGLLFNYKEKGSQAELAGKETVDGAACFKIKLTDKSGTPYTLFIDDKTWYCVKLVGKGQDGQEASTSFFDFKKTDSGYTFPFSQTNPRGTIAFTSIETNVAVDPKIFSVN